MSTKALIKFKDDSHFDKIRAHFLDPTFSLSEFEQKKFERIKYLFSLRLKSRISRQQAVDRLVADYPDISIQTAYREYQMMSELYGELDEVNLAAERLFNRENYYMMWQQLIKERNWEAAAKVYEKYEKTFPVQNDNEIDPDKVSAHEYHLKIPKHIMKMFEKMFSDGNVLNFNTSDADFEIIDEDE